MKFLSVAQGVVRQRLNGRSLPPYLRKDLVAPLLDIQQLLKRTVELGEGNSLLIIGPKGCGKTALLRKSLEILKDDDGKIAKNLMEVHLNGLMQTDDKLALQEITRQLKLENTVEDRVFGSFSENLAFLLEALKTGQCSSSCPILFVLEEFDLFAMHKNQTLLYNLFDLTQSGTTPMAVIGITCRLDVMDLFEKRVKSRFSHRQIYITNGNTFEEYVENLKDCLLLDAEFLRIQEGNKNDRKVFMKQWNDYISKIVSDPSVLRSLQSQYSICRDITPLFTILSLPLGRLDPNRDPSLICSAIIDTISFSQGDDKANILHGLSVLEMCLIIAMHHITNIYEEPFNFQMVYNEYLKFAKRRSHILQNYSKQVVMKAYEHLIELELVRTADFNVTGIFAGSRSKLQKEYRPMSLLVEQAQLHEAIHKYNGCPTDVKQWATSNIE